MRVRAHAWHLWVAGGCAVGGCAVGAGCAVVAGGCAVVVLWLLVAVVVLWLPVFVPDYVLM